MVQKKGKRTLIITLAIVLVLLVAITTIALIKMNSNKQADPYVNQDTASKSDKPKEVTPEDTKQEVEIPQTDTQLKTAPQLDSATVATVDIAPMSITVSYVKGAGSFEYEVLRTTNGTRYVVFSSPELVGTKCTNDKGTFASVLASPDSNESSTIAKSTTVDGTTYGLSLEPPTCTSNADKLQVYQKSFSDAFSLLKKMN